jgi:serine kinase of HPr protein (carbohydrate metabolism regulator)
MVAKKTIHGTAIQDQGVGWLLSGPSGSGKSDLALRLMAHGAQLIADDQVTLWSTEERLWATCPMPIQGLMEVRGIGLIHRPFLTQAPIHGLIKLLPHHQIERFPSCEHMLLCGRAVPVHYVDPFEASALIKIRLLGELMTGAVRPLAVNA